MNTKRLITLTLGCAMFAAPAYLAAAPQDQDSVADAARKAQAEKKTAPKAKLTIDNDNLGTLTGSISVVGQDPAADDQAKKAADNAPKTDKGPAKDETYWRQRFTAANKKLADDEHELDIMQRELNLKQEQFYTDPMASLKQDYSRQDINDSKTKIDEMTATVAKDKDDLSNLQDELRQSGGDPGWANPSTQPPSDSTSTPAATSAPAPAPASAPAPQQ
jgi:chromosome segregation ATPase